MDEIEKLKGLLEKMPAKKLTAKLQKLMPTIDQRLRDGITQEEIVEMLNANGFSVNINTFRTNLYRYRQSINARPSSQEKTNGNLSFSTPEIEKSEQVSTMPTFSDMLDPRKRDEFTEKYMNRKPPIFKKERSET
jgi:hypothetical protein